MDNEDRSRGTSASCGCDPSRDDDDGCDRRYPVVQLLVAIPPGTMTTKVSVVDSVRGFGPQMFASSDRVPKVRADEMLETSGRTRRVDQAAWAAGAGI
jgi:hypothetical protein